MRGPARELCSGGAAGPPLSQARRRQLAAWGELSSRGGLELGWLPAGQPPASGPQLQESFRGGLRGVRQPPWADWLHLLPRLNP